MKTKSNENRKAGKNPKHDQRLEKFWVQSSTNSRQLFLVTALTVQHPVMLYKIATPGKIKISKIMQLLILMTAVVIRHPRLSFDMPTTWEGKIRKLKTMYTGLTAPANIFFTPTCTDPTPLDFDTHTTSLDVANDALNAGTGTKGDRDAAWEVAYFQDAKGVIAYAQKICIAHPDQAQRVAEALGLVLSETSATDVDDFRAKMVSLGCVELVGKLKKQKCIFQWQGTRDPTTVIGWYEKDIPPTKECKTTVNDLAEGKWHFRMRKIFAKGTPGEWSNVITVMVKNS